MEKSSKGTPEFSDLVKYKDLQMRGKIGGKEPKKWGTYKGFGQEDGAL